jgi:hypothetical protein
MLQLLNLERNAWEQFPDIPDGKRHAVMTLTDN